MLELYNALTDAQKHTVRRKYISLFGCKRTFHRKIRGDVRLSKAEIIFFANVGLLNHPLLETTHPIQQILIPDLIKVQEPDLIKAQEPV